ncbi:MAG: Fatty acid desaturase [Chloroflexi bacterium ADurb.Bin325]|nr:MAG: Fatty acid desaturase [Chloroflexi bacterium ADurb.Bin325]
MDAEVRKSKVSWYRSPVDRQTLAGLNRRSNLKGFVQTLGHLGLLVLTGAAAWYSAGHLALPVTLLLLFLHGTFYAFLLNGFHELCHSSVFRTRWLNTLFLYIISFLGQFNPILFWASHQEHHKYTLYPPDDLEVVLPVELTLASFLKSALINPWGFVGRWKGVIRLSLGRLDGEWEHALFPESAVAARRRLFNWARILLVGHLLLVVVSLLLGWYMLPVLITLAPFYGGWLLYLCNNTQHVGLQDNVPDFRLCCRTITLNPFLQFIYWHMNFHTEHHMYASVPCYNLGKLHRAIKPDLPHCPAGLVETWQGIIAILRKQKADPTYEYVPALPTPARV